ncbi:MAG: ribonuclease E/G [Lachnospiraceae bacterium]|nr:ribonuclease E/G [Lachnospiraceae bacterium]
MSKLIITRWRDRILTAQFSGNEALELSLEEDSSILGNLYIGKVNNIVKNLNSAFIDFEKERTGYYSLTDNPQSLYPDGSWRSLKAGDEILVQVAKDAVKTKDPVLTGNLNFTGKYAVLTAGKPVIGFSSKISDKTWKEQLRPQLEALVTGQTGLIVRTNAYGHDAELLQEVQALTVAYQTVLEKARYRTCYSLLYQADPGYLKNLRGSTSGSIEEIVTDQPEVFETISDYLRQYDADKLSRLRLYEDTTLSLSRLYSLDSMMEQACQKRVWLKSGGYLIIEQTEAMVVIDVNTGKYSGKKNLADTIRMINLEAAKELCHQLRLRNLSGIIMVDFIDMKAEEDKRLLMDTLRTCVLSDPVKTTVVDMTGLNLVEMTRKKEKKPLWEQIAQVKQQPETT